MLPERVFFTVMIFSTSAKKCFMCVSGFSSEKNRYGLLGLSFYFTKIFYIDIAFFTTFPPFSSIFYDIFLKIHNKMFRVGAKN